MKKDKRTFNYINSIFYLLVNDGVLIVDQHEYLWENAKLRGPKLHTKEHLKDHWATRARNAVAAFSSSKTRTPTGDRSRDRDSPGRDRSRNAGDGDDNNKKKKKKLPADAPPSFTNWIKSRCLRCGADDHRTDTCPIAAKEEDRSDEDKAKIKAFKDKSKKVRETRKKYLKNINK